jgi:hypothetical protein
MWRPIDLWYAFRSLIVVCIGTRLSGVLRYVLQ